MGFKPSHWRTGPVDAALSKRKKKKPEAHKGIHCGPNGTLKVDDPEYMGWLHREQIPPLELGLRPGPGILELHHAQNPSGGKRRDNDAAVVPLTRQEHHALEFECPAEEKTFSRLFGTWSAFSYWCFKFERSHSPESGQEFLAWTLEQLQKESDV